MILTRRRRDAALAEQRWLLARRGWQRKTHGLRAGIARHPDRWIVGGGFVGGAIAALIPLRGIGRVVRVVTGIASFALRTSLGAVFTDVISHKPPVDAIADPAERDA